MIEQGRQGAVAVVRTPIPLVEETLGPLADVLEQRLADGQPKTVLDLEKIPLIDSAGLELLMSVQENHQYRGGALKLAAPNGLCRDILSITGVDQHLELYDDVTEAVRSFVR